jgi:hypothetical protein
MAMNFTNLPSWAFGGVQPFDPTEGTTDPQSIERNRRGRLNSILGLWKQYPGRQPGGTGSTGLMSGDARGWSQVLQDQIDAMNLSRKPGNPMTVVELPYEEDSRDARRKQLAQMDAARGGLQSAPRNTDWNYNPGYGR